MIPFLEAIYLANWSWLTIHSLMLLLLIQHTKLQSFVKIGTLTNEILLTLSLCWWWRVVAHVSGVDDRVGGGVQRYFHVKPNLCSVLFELMVELGLWQLYEALIVNRVTILARALTLQLVACRALLYSTTTFYTVRVLFNIYSMFLVLSLTSIWGPCNV